MGDIKKAISPSYLSYSFGIELTDIIWYIRSVNYYEKPDYDFIRNKFYAILQSKAHSNN